MSHRHRFLASLVRACVETLEDRRLMSFASAVNYPVGVMPENVETADFNRDGRLDLAVCNWLNNSVSVLLGDGNGQFGARRDSLPADSMTWPSATSTTTATSTSPPPPTPASARCSATATAHSARRSALR